MRIVVDLPTVLARRAAQAVEGGLYPSIDALLVEALSGLLPPDDVKPLESAGAQVATPVQDGANADPSPSRPVGAYVYSTAVGTGWLWGMINRVFPLKVAVRACADMTRRGPVLLQSLHAHFADEGRRIGQLLASADRDQGRRRNEALAVAFPVSSPDEQKARVRFAHQFIGRRSAGGLYIGGAFEMALLGVTEPGTDWIAPTELGWQFAELTNRVLDEGVVTGPNLDEPERRFYLCNIARRVPAERNAFTAILGVLYDAPLEASTLASRLRVFQSPDLPESMRDTSRSGALARLADVGGIVRIATGRSALYEITALGRDAYERLATTEATSQT
ncbi:hypothetical protein BH11GEM1_BH11GEM1_27550 [soil metagenome]